MKRPAMLAVDGGGSKVDAVLLTRGGDVVAAVRLNNLDHDGTDSETYLDGVESAVNAVRDRAGLHPDRTVSPLGAFCLAGADLPADDRRIARWLAKRSFTTETIVRNDTFAVLRAGTERTWGVAVVCGYGTNCSGVAPDGRMFRLPAVGGISGDWGGGHDIGGMALWFALRAQDGRGEPTSLATLVPEHFGLRRPRQVMEAMYFHRLDEERVIELPPVVFRAAAGGDAVAQSIVDRQADEVVAMAGTAIRKLRMRSLDVEVVLGGGIFRNRHPAFFERIEQGLRAIAPTATITVLGAPPVVGAALLGLDRLGATKAARAKVRAALTHDRMNADTLRAT